MTWRKLGLVFRAAGQRPWLCSHASLPVALPLGDGRLRVYFASRDERNRSHVGWVELDPEKPDAEPVLAEEPVLAPGPLGHFDDHGVYPASLVEHDGRLLLYTIGWNPGVREPLFYASIGLAVSDDGGRTFERVSRAPVLARGEHDPCLVTAPCVLVEGGRFRMWYVSGLGWEEGERGLGSRYHVQYAESADGVTWVRDGRVCIGLRERETNVSRPCVRREGGGYRMWYAADAGQGYRIGYAESRDGLDWTRLDDRAGISLSDKGWDSRAQAYPCVVEHRGRRLMLYNGNDFGRDGFGVAVEEGPA